MHAIYLKNLNNKVYNNNYKKHLPPIRFFCEIKKLNINNLKREENNINQKIL